MSNNSFAGINFNNPDSKEIFETQSKMMCPLYKSENDDCFIDNLLLEDNNNGILLITGTVKESNEEYYIKYVAANPPTYSSNFSGSGLPYPTENIAYENTLNKGVIRVEKGKFSFKINYPNSYYKNMGTVHVKPHVKVLLFNDKNENIGEEKILYLGEGIPFRAISRNIKNTSPLFYVNNNLPVRTQYQILLDSAYPSTNTVPNNFWGSMPPH